MGSLLLYRLLEKKPSHKGFRHAQRCVPLPHYDRLFFWLDAVANPRKKAKAMRPLLALYIFSGLPQPQAAD